MMSHVCRFAVVVALLPMLGCGDDGSSGPVLEDFLPELPGTGGAQSVFAGPITANNTQELILGPASSGVVGDYFLRNDTARFVIGAPKPVVGIVAPGGNVIDVAPLAGDGSDLVADQFGETAMVYQMGRQCRHSSMEVVRDGRDGGAAVLRARGVTGHNQYVNLRGIGLLPIPNQFVPDIEDGAECATTYILAPGSATLQTYLTLFNPTETAIRGPMGLLSDVGGEAYIFIPGVGFSLPGDYTDAIAGDSQSGPYMAWQGTDVAYGLIPRHGEVGTPNAGLSLLGVSAYFFGIESFLDSINTSKPAFLNIDPNGGFTFELDIFVGTDAAQVEAEYQRLIGVTTREISGMVRYSDDSVVPNPRIGIFSDTNNNGEIDNDEPIVSLINGKSDGSFAGAVPAGNYLLRAELLNRARSSAVAVSTTSGAASVQLQLERPVAYHFRIVDDGNGDEIIPGRITVIGEHPFAPDIRTFGEYDTYKGIVTTLVAQRGTSVDIGDGADPQLILPAGSYRVFVSRGTEWAIAQMLLSPAVGDVPDELEFRLRRLVDTSGYISSEYHVHSLGSPDSPVPDARRVATAVADGIEFYATTDHDFISEHQPVIEELGLKRRVRSIRGTEISPLVFGHFNAWPLERDNRSPTGGAVDWPLGTAGFVMTPAEIFAAARKLGAELVQVNHPRKGPEGGSTVTEYFDRMDLSFDYDKRTFGGDVETMPIPADWLRLPSDEKLFDDGFNALEVWNGFGVADTNGDGVREISQLDIVMRDWFNFLSFGKTLTPTASSDTHTEVQEPMGMPRTLVRVSDDSADAIEAGTQLTAEVIATLTATNGKTTDLVMTDGPVIRLTVDSDDAPLGKVHNGGAGTIALTVRVQSPNWAHIDTIEVFSNGTPEVGDVAVSALQPMACFTTRTELQENDPCGLATLGGAATLSVNEVIVEGAFTRFESSISMNISPADIPARVGATGQDAWFVVRVRGNRSIYPLFIGELFAEEDVSTFVAGVPAEVEAALEGKGRPATALTSAFYVDFDGGGYTAPFAP